MNVIVIVIVKHQNVAKKKLALVAKTNAVVGIKESDQLILLF